MPEPRVAAKSFIVNDGKLLIIRRRPNDVQKPNVWEIPGGRLGIGEDPYEGLKRETKEETGINIDVLHPLNIKYFTRDDDQTITMLIFLCKPLTTDIKLSKEHTEFEWISMENAKEKIGKFFHEDIDIFHKLDLGRHV